MDKGHSYTSGTEKALFLLSRGHCYHPSCGWPVLQMLDGEPTVTAHIAHIHGDKPGSARFDPSMSSLERRSFANLMLLCEGHHKRIDRGKNAEKEYPAELLKKWKQEREREVQSQLKGLSGLTEDRLQSLMEEAVVKTKSEIDRAIEEIATVNKGAADVIQSLTEESFNRPYLNPDAIESLEYSARIFMNLEESFHMLDRAARDLRHLEDTVPVMSRFTQSLEDIEVHRLVDALEQADRSSGLRSISSDVNAMEDLSGRIEEATRELGSVVSINQEKFDQRWDYLKIGVVTGLVVAALLVVICWIIFSQAGA